MGKGIKTKKFLYVPPKGVFYTSKPSMKTEEQIKNCERMREAMRTIEYKIDYVSKQTKFGKC